MSEEAIQELTVHPISNPAMTGNGVRKVFQLEGSLEATGKESTKRSNSRSKDGQHHGMPLNRIEIDLSHANANLHNRERLNQHAL